MSARTMLRICLSIFAAVLIGLTTYSSAQAANNPTPVSIYAGFQSPPGCVSPRMNARFPLRVTNNGKRAETFTVLLTYITPLEMADAYSVVITDGTDHLSGIQGAEFWRFRLAPGQSAVKHLVTRIQPQYETKRGPATYSVTEMVTVADQPGLLMVLTATTPYCM